MALSGPLENILEFKSMHTILEQRTVAVVIPFFQKEVGILRRAMIGVLEQNLPAGIKVHVFIINDSSPLPPDQDLKNLSKRDDISWTVHHQLNAGPGAARNRGLDLADAATADFVAFLDSDDEWLPQHLSDAITALDQGYGFYFCDNQRDNSHESYAETVHALARKGADLRAKATLISQDGPVLGFAQTALAAEIINEYLCQTSCVVLDRIAAKSHRFDPDLRLAGEDYFFWVGLAVSKVKIAISWRINVMCGEGLNIYFSSFDWNSPATLNRLGYLLLMSEKMQNLPAASAIGGRSIKAHRRKNRRAYSYMFVRSLIKGRRPDAGILRKIARYDPMIYVRIPLLFLKTALDSRPGSRDW